MRPFLPLFLPPWPLLVVSIRREAVALLSACTLFVPEGAAHSLPFRIGRIAHHSKLIFNCNKN